LARQSSSQPREESRPAPSDSTLGTAGSITLVLQTLMPLLPYAPGTVELEITGGDRCEMDPPIDYLRLVTASLASERCSRISSRLSKRNYPKGGGIVRLNANPTSALKGIVGVARG